MVSRFDIWRKEPATSVKVVSTLKRHKKSDQMNNSAECIGRIACVGSFINTGDKSTGEKGDAPSFVPATENAPPPSFVASNRTGTRG